MSYIHYVTAFTNSYQYYLFHLQTNIMKQYQHHIHKSVVTFLLFISHLTLHACLENPPSRNGPPANGLDWIANNLILPKFSKLEDEASPK